MKTSAALLSQVPGKWEVHEIDLEDPKPTEVRVRVVAAGLCHSDDHWATGDIPIGHLPYCGGHEGAGVVEAVGSAVTTVRVGDHVATSWIASCGRCRWCAGGQQNLCDNGSKMLTGSQLDGTFRLFLDGEPVGQSGMVSTFAHRTVMSALSVIPIDPDIPLELAALVSCGVATGWGSAVNAAGVEPGDVIIVAGVGGVGINAVQGARHAGATHIVAVDPVPFKLDHARRLGATATFTTLEEAADFARSVTDGQGADSAVITVGVPAAEVIQQAFSAIRKAGTVVLTSASPRALSHLDISLLELTMYQKRLQGSIFGGMSPNKDVPRLLRMWRAGQLELESLVTRTYQLDEINQGYEDLLAGRNIRGIIRYGD